MLDIESLIDLIRKRPAMYVGVRSLTYVAMFIHGYIFALHLHTKTSDAAELMGQFGGWLALRYKIRDALGWDGIILRIAGNEEEGLNLFWQLWDEYHAYGCPKGCMEELRKLFWDGKL